MNKDIGSQINHLSLSLSFLVSRRFRRSLLQGSAVIVVYTDGA